MRAIGLVANPASGKDVRRITTRASVFNNQEKIAMLRRAAAGIRAFSAAPIRYLPDAHHLAQSALAELGVDAEPLPVAIGASVNDTVEAARALRGAAAVIVLGGDGTNRAFAQGWLDAPLISLAAGTNNAYPQACEATTAGAAAGLLANGAMPLAEVATQAKVIHVDIEGEAPDLALIDAVLTRDRFLGARALDDSAKLVCALLTRADPAGVGMTSIGGFAHPLSADEEGALTLRFRADAARQVLAATAPGRFERVGIAHSGILPFGEAMRVQGPGTLALDGERERTLGPGQTATLRAARDGPWVVDVQRTLARTVQNLPHGLAQVATMPAHA